MNAQLTLKEELRLIEQAENDKAREDLEACYRLQEELDKDEALSYYTTQS